MKRVIVSVLTVVILCIFFNVGVNAEAETVSLNKDDIVLFPGQSFYLKLTNGKDNYSCLTENESVASVTQNGVITAQNPGNTVIKCITGNTTLKCKVTVKKGQKPTEVILTSNVLSMVKGEQINIGARIIPEKQDAYINYVSSDESIITVDKNGNVNAVDQGSAVVTVETESAAVSASCLVQVSAAPGDISQQSELCGVIYNARGDKLQNTYVMISGGSLSETGFTDEDGRFYFKQIPQGAYVLTVGGIEGVNTGVSANIFVNSESINLSCILMDGELAVLQGSNNITAGNIRDIKLMQGNIKMTSGETYDIAAVLTPADAKGQKLLYRSEDPKIADVDKMGRITALNEGGTIIYVSTPDGTVSDKMTVNVTRYGTGIFGMSIFIMLAFIAVLIITVFYHLKRKMTIERGEK